MPGIRKHLRLTICCGEGEDTSILSRLICTGRVANSSVLSKPQLQTSSFSISTKAVSAVFLAAVITILVVITDFAGEASGSMSDGTTFVTGASPTAVHLPFSLLKWHRLGTMTRRKKDTHTATIASCCQ